MFLKPDLLIECWIYAVKMLLIFNNNSHIVCLFEERYLSLISSKFESSLYHLGPYIAIVKTISKMFLKGSLYDSSNQYKIYLGGICINMVVKALILISEVNGVMQVNKPNKTPGNTEQDTLGTSKIKFPILTVWTVFAR